MNNGVGIQSGAASFAGGKHKSSIRVHSQGKGMVLEGYGVDNSKACIINYSNGFAVIGGHEGPFVIRCNENYGRIGAGWQKGGNPISGSVDNG
ncbi:hypothetical protein D3C75_925610 [compost metagenome]